VIDFVGERTKRLGGWRKTPFSPLAAALARAYAREFPTTFKDAFHADCTEHKSSKNRRKSDAVGRPRPAATRATLAEATAPTLKKADWQTTLSAFHSAPVFFTSNASKTRVFPARCIETPRDARHEKTRPDTH